MWVMTTEGFLSAVEEKYGPHRGMIVVRARERRALHALGKVAPALTEIQVGTDSDYRYRAWLGREEWAAALAEMGRAIDYSNFKDAVFRRQGHSRYEAALHKVWSVLGHTQPTGPYGWGGRNYPPALKGEPRKRKPRKPKPDQPVTCFFCGAETTGANVVSAGQGRWACREVGPCLDRERTAAGRK